jgi:hypothetical protein
MIAAAALFATPALAQGTGSSSSSNAQAGHPGTTPNGAKITAETQQKLRQSLDQSGFTNIQIVAESFLVRAQAPDGSHVLMTVSPDEVAGIVTPTGSAQSGSSTGTGAGTSSSGGQSSGNHSTSSGPTGPGGSGSGAK